MHVKKMLKTKCTDFHESTEFSLILQDPIGLYGYGLILWNSVDSIWYQDTVGFYNIQ